MSENKRIVFIGPGRVTKFLQVDRTLNREPLTTSTGLWIEDDGPPPPRFKATPRIGIAYATKRDQSRKWRFVAVVAVGPSWSLN